MRNDIGCVLRERYEQDPVKCDPCVVGWAADYIAEAAGIDRAARETNSLNARRMRAGAAPWKPQPGSPLGDAMLAR